MLLSKNVSDLVPEHRKKAIIKKLKKGLTKHQLEGITGSTLSTVLIQLLATITETCTSNPSVFGRQCTPAKFGDHASFVKLREGDEVVALKPYDSHNHARKTWVAGKVDAFEKDVLSVVFVDGDKVKGLHPGIRATAKMLLLGIVHCSNLE